MNVCKIENCEGKYSTKGFCRKHYIRFWRWGDPLALNRHLHSGNSKHPLYVTYDTMKSRCFNPNNINYKNYGARGITVCERWLGADGFKNFLQDMGEKPSKNYTLDRIDDDGHYEPENCKWSHWITQGINKRSNNAHPGVYKKRNKYYAMIEKNRKKEYLGTFETLEEAMTARKAAEIRYIAMV